MCECAGLCLCLLASAVISYCTTSVCIQCSNCKSTENHDIVQGY